MTTKPVPTDAELAILGVLWRRGSATVREVHEELGTGTGYTTVLKTMQIMSDKALVTRDESERSHRYKAAIQAEPTQKRLISSLVQKAFGGSASSLVMRALSSARPSKKELAEVRAMLDALEKDAGRS
jgi:predicted transcriptional regulator